MNNEGNEKQAEPLCEDGKEKEICTSGQNKVEQKNAPGDKMENSEILTFLREHSDILRDIQQSIENRLEYDAAKEKAFDKLYEEMRKAKEMSDLQDRAIKPILTDLVLLYDSMKRIEAGLKGDARSDEKEMAKDIKHLLLELTEVMYRQEVVPIDENIPEAFNSKLQKAIGIEDTSNIEEDKKIKRIIRSGFLWRGKVLRPQEVVVNRHNPDKETIKE